MTASSAPGQLLGSVLSLARQASKAILDVYSTSFKVDIKTDDSPLTQADQASHEIISRGLEKLTPDIPVLSEESPAEVHQFSNRKRWTQHWLVDPLDGTREFINRNGEFTINIALIRDHRPVLGVVVAPALDLAYYAADGEGAWRLKGGDSAKPERIAVQKQARDPVLVAASRSHRGDSLDAMLARMGRYECKSVGSALKLCWVADGGVDLYPRLGSTSEWDTAAGQAVVELAGGKVTDVAGETLRYNLRESLINPHFLAFGDASRDWKGLL